MSNNEFQLYINNDTKNNSKNILENTESLKYQSRNKEKIENDDEIEEENNELILPKLNNNILKQTHENEINYFTQTKETSNQSLKVKESINNNNENNNSINSKEKEEKIISEEKKIINNFNKHKINLMKICVEIEDNLSQIYFQIDNNNNEINTKNNINKEEKEILKKIKNYKERIKSAQNELDIELKINKVDELEYNLKQKKNYLLKLKNENKALKSLKNLQEKDEKDIKDLLNKKEELFNMNEKIIKIKDEAKIKKNYYKTLIEQIKNQNQQINSLKNKCELINKNILYYKQKQIQTNKNIENNNNINYDNIDLNQIKYIYNEKALNIIEKQEKIKNKIQSQNIKIQEISDFNQNLLINLNKIMIKIKLNMNYILTIQNELKKKEIQIVDSINKHKKNYKNNTLNGKKPFRIGSVNIKPKNKIKKRFDYEKYLKEFERNKNNIKLYSSADIINNKNQTLKEIEGLKNDIQKVINKTKLDDKIDKIITELKKRKNNNYKKINIKINNDEDVLKNLFQKNNEINGSNRYNFYVTEGPNLPNVINQENFNNNNLNSS